MYQYGRFENVILDYFSLERHLMLVKWVAQTLIVYFE